MAVVTYTWNDGTSGDWGVGTNWSGSVVPDGGSNATIGGSGSETVTVSSNESANVLTLDDVNATLSITGYGTTLTAYSGLAVTAAQAIDIGGDSTLSLSGGSETLDNTTINLGFDNNGDTGILTNAGTNEVLTFGSNLNVDVASGAYGEIGGGAELINQGTITDAGDLAVLGDEFVNKGTINVGGKGSFEPYYSFINDGNLIFDGSGNGSIVFGNLFDNEGRISVNNDATLTIEWEGDDGEANNGTITVGFGGRIVLGDDYYAGTFGGSGSFVIDSGGTLEITNSEQAVSTDVSFAGAGTLQLDGENVYKGTISGLAAGDVLDFHGMDVTSASVSGTKLSVKFADNTSESFTLAQSLPAGDNVYTTIDGQGGTDVVIATTPPPPPPTTTWVDGTSGDWGIGTNWSGSVVPDGTANATIGGSGSETVTVSSNETTNVLTLDDANATLSITNGATLTAHSGLVLTAAQAIDIGGGSTLSLSGGSETLANTTINLGGGSDQGYWGTLFNAGMNEVLTLGSNLNVDVASGDAGSIGAGTELINEGTITDAGDLYVSSDEFVNDGNLSFDGSATTSSITALFDNEGSFSVTNDATLTIESYGFNANNGTIVARSGGRVVLEPFDDLFGGSGSFVIDDGGTLEIANGGQPVSTDVSFAATGTLQLDSKKVLYTGTISGLAAGDALDFHDIDVTNASVSGTTLSITFADNTTDNFTLAQDLPAGDNVYTTIDGTGGTDVVVGPTTQPAITSIAASGQGISNGSGELVMGDTATLTVDFNGTVAVNTAGGAPTLQLNNGGVATYSGGSGTGALTFSYTVAAGQNTADLSVLALSLNGAIIPADISGASDYNPAGTLLVDTTAPTLSLSSATGDAIQGGAPVTALGSVSISDPDGPGTLTGATVTIANALTGDLLGIDGAQSGTLDSGAISYAWSATDDTLTLSGSDSIADYETALAAVTYQDTGTDSSTGNHPSRTLDWSVSNALYTSSPDQTAITIDRAPAITSETIPVTAFTLTSTAADNVLASGQITDLDGDSLTVISVDGVAGNVGEAVAAPDGTLTLNGDGSFTYQETGTSTPTTSFTYAVSDGNGGTTTGTLTFSGTYLEPTGRTFTSETISYTQDGAIAEIDYAGFTGLPYTSKQVFYGSNGKPARATYSDGETSTWAYNPDGSYSITSLDTPGVDFTSQTDDYSASGVVTGAVLTGITGEPYTSETIGYTNGAVSEIDYAGFSKLAYTSEDITYGINGKPASAVYSDGETQTWTYNADGSYDIAYTDVPGATYASRTNGYNSNGTLTETSLVGISGRAYTEETTFYTSSGATSAIDYAGFSGKAYTSEDVTYGGNGKQASAVYSDGETATWTYNNDGSYDITYADVTGAAYKTLENEYDTSGKLALSVESMSNGTEIITGHENFLTLTGVPGATLVGGGSDENFVFGANFGKEAVSDFYLAGHVPPVADTITLPETEFADFAAMIGDAKNVGANVVITAANQDKLTIDHASIALLQAHEGDFRFA